jgi:hypothetical protein
MSFQNLKQYGAADYTTSYTSDIQKVELRGNRTGVFQANLNTGDSLVLQGRLNNSFNWVDILTATDSDVLSEITLAPETQLVVTNVSGLAVNAGLHI